MSQRTIGWVWLWPFGSRASWPHSAIVRGY